MLVAFVASPRHYEFASHVSTGVSIGAEYSQQTLRLTNAGRMRVTLKFSHYTFHFVRFMEGFLFSVLESTWWIQKYGI